MQVLLSPSAQKNLRYTRGDEMNAIRREVLDYIDIIPDIKLDALRPLLRVLVSEQPFIIETNLTPSEKESIAIGMAEYKSAPETFRPISEVM
jgi:hypothetical protein